LNFLFRKKSSILTPSKIKIAKSNETVLSYNSPIWCW